MCVRVFLNHVNGGWKTYPKCISILWAVMPRGIQSKMLAKQNVHCVLFPDCRQNVTTRLTLLLCRLSCQMGLPLQLSAKLELSVSNLL